MLESVSPEYRTIFLLKFTRELILNSANQETKQLEILLNQKVKETLLRKKLKEEVRRENPRVEPSKEEYFQSVKKLSQEISSTPRGQLQMPSILQAPAAPRRREIISTQRIPNVQLPDRFSYLKPVPVQEELNLGKLNSLLKDPRIKEVQCDGEGKEVTIIDNFPKGSGIFLNSDEIKQILEEFSKKTKIPLTDGIIKIAAGKFILTGIISTTVGSKFIIKKIPLTSPPARY